MARRPPTMYQYKNGDDPLTVANQFGITPQELINANPGGYPFDPGQTIKLPYKRPPTPPGATGTTGYQYQNQNRGAPAWLPPLSVNFNWNGNQYQNQLGQAYTQAGLYGVQQALPGIGADIASEGLNTINQAGTFATGTVNAIGNQAVTGYQNAYANVPDDVIRRIAVVNPGLAYSLARAKEIEQYRGSTTGGRGGARPQTGVGNPGTPYMMGRGGFQTAYIPPGLNYQRQTPTYGTDDSWAFGSQAQPPAAPGAFSPAAGNPVLQTSNNYLTNPALYHLTYNQNAKNVRNRFETNLKWAQNAWRRKAGRGKNRRAQVQQQQAEQVTLSNSLVNFGAGSG